jgi:hypothetical protein
VTLLWLLAVVLGAFLLAAMVQRVIMGRLEFKAGPVVNTALPEITDVRSQVDTVIAEEVERLKSQIRDIQTREVEIVEALAEGTKIDKAALRLLQQTIKDVERLGQGVASRKRG